jgi:coat protein Gp5
MPNVIFTPTLFTKLTLMELGQMLKVCRNMSTEYSKEFGNKKQKAGSRFNVRKPQRFVGTDGLAYNPEALSNKSTEVVVDQVSGVHFEWDAVEKTLDLDHIREKYAKPAARSIAAKVNKKAAEYIAKRTANSVGTPGADPTTMLAYLNAGDKLVEMGLPEGSEEDLACIINRRMSSTYVDASRTLFNESSLIGKQHRTGKVVNTLGYKWEIDQKLYVHTIGAFAGTPLVNGANQTGEEGNNGEMSLITDGWTATTSVLNEGDRFSIAGVNSVDPETRQDTGSLQQFVVRAQVTADGSGNKTITIYPQITPSGQYQNVTAAPANDAAITMIGTASEVTTQGLLLHKNAFTFVSVPLDVDAAGAVVSQETDDETGLSLTFTRQLNSDNLSTRNRFDCLYGFAPLYRELACAIQAA